jgi:hypothetical protein
MSPAIEAFTRHFEFMQSMTIAFADGVPDEHWSFSPHPRFAPFNKQLRHVICVRGGYRDAIVTGKTDFSRKHEHYTGSLDRGSLRDALLASHESLVRAVADADDAGADRPAIEFMGRKLSLHDMSHVIVQHDSIHLGEWSLYASLAGFETPLMWRLQWGL